MKKIIKPLDRYFSMGSFCRLHHDSLNKISKYDDHYTCF